MSQDKHTKTARADWPDSQEDQDYHPPALTAAQAASWRARHRQVSPWKVLACQAAVALLALPLVWLISQNSVAIISWLYGFMAIWLPALLFGAVVVSQPSLGALVLSEMGKLLLTILLMVLAPWLLVEVVWPVLLMAVVLTVNMYWIAPIWLSRSRRV